MAMTIRFWGVRGSIPSPGPSTAKYGGNTPCVSVEMGNDRILVLDAGTGIRDLGKHLLSDPSAPKLIYVLLTHEHWDHIQGFPFFAPIYQKDRKVVIFPVQRGKNLFCSLLDQMDGAHFPVTYDQLPSVHECTQSDPATYLKEQGVEMSRKQTNHPGKCFGYRITHGGRSIVFMPDNELNPPANRLATLEEFADFCRGADLLIHDSQFLPTDMPHKRGWGHSLVSETCQLAAAAQVKHLILYHHDPDRTDAQLDAIEAESRRWFADHAPKTRVTAGREGMVIEL
ncbi:MAG TPA: MBL fold metallo-hydrolase [Tepidisphaeraceae bacterium]|nr:MBL fold metallo-hydrolase [Tepidisphaeraceae bacterium]